MHPLRGIHDTGLQGVYPVEVLGVLVEGTTVAGSRDAPSLPATLPGPGWGPLRRSVNYRVWSLLSALTG